MGNDGLAIVLALAVVFVPLLIAWVLCARPASRRPHHRRPGRM